MTTHPGQTLVILLVFISTSVIIAASAATLNIVNSTVSSRIEVSQDSYNIAEAGLENALIRLLRDPQYTGETLAVGQGTTVITITGTNPYTITSQATLDNYTRSISAIATFSSGVMTVANWQEIYP